jgi:hypothetical protein
MRHSGHASDSVESVAKVPQAGHDIAANCQSTILRVVDDALLFLIQALLSRISHGFSD